MLECASCPVRDSAACSALTDQERADLARSGRTRTLARGEHLFTANEPGEACATLVRGALKISRTNAAGQERILALVHPAGFVGELFRPVPGYDVVALTQSELCVFSGERFSAAIEAHPALARALLRRAQEELYEGRVLIALSGNGSARARLAGILLALGRAASNSPCHPAARFELPLNRGELASLLGLTIETVSRTIGALERDRLIARYGSRGIELLDPAHLSAIGEAVA